MAEYGGLVVDCSKIIKKRMECGFMKGMILAVSLVLGTSILVSGCFNKPEPAMPTLEPSLVGVFQFKGSAFGTDPKNALSPDGKRIMLVRTDSKGSRVSIMSLESKGSTGASSTEPITAAEITVDSVSKDWLQGNIFSYYPLGWVSDQKVIYSIFGWMDDGPNKGKRGLSIREADLGGVSVGKETTSQEVFFREISKGFCRDRTFLKEKGKIYFTFSAVEVDGKYNTVLSEFDVAKGKERVIKDNLPSYDGLFSPRLSPDGMFYVYDIHEEGRHGIYLLDTTTGEEKPLIPAKDTLSLLPTWSPDGKQIAAYTVGRLPGQNGEYPAAYRIFPGEDSPLPIGESIIIVDTSGNLIKNISIEGKYVSALKWSSDSKLIGFFSGIEKTVDASSFQGIGGIKYESVWQCGIGQKETPLALADISKMAESSYYIFPLAIAPDMKGFYFVNYGPEKGPSIWYASKDQAQPQDGKTPAENLLLVSEGSMEQDPPIFGNSLLGIVQGQNATALWALSPKEAKKIRDFRAQGYVAIVGFGGNSLVVYEGDPAGLGEKDDTSSLFLYKLTK